MLEQKMKEVAGHHRVSGRNCISLQSWGVKGNSVYSSTLALSALENEISLLYSFIAEFSGFFLNKNMKNLS